MIEKKNKLDAKSFFTLIAFIIVGILLFTMIFLHNSREIENKGKVLTPKNVEEKNSAPDEKFYYGSQALSYMPSEVYDKSGNKIDPSSLKKETELFDKNGKMMNLPTISPSEYKKISNGMSYEDLCKLIGGNGEKVREVDKPGDEFYTVCYFFYGDKAESSASFILQSNKIKSKANTGLVSKKK
ncbi:MAG: hypothetical protein Q8873_08970 [Bacillota bacterium]|nr:hypothetical protein [Bacillota bacterium]